MKNSTIINLYIAFAISFLLICLFLPATVHAFDFQIETEFYKTISTDPDRIVQSGYGGQLKIKSKHFYVYGSSDKTPVEFKNQSGIDINLYSAGVGVYHSVRLDKKFNFDFGLDVGWYHPKYKNNRQTFPSQLSEGLWREMNSRYSTGNRCILFPEYSVNYRGAIGGNVFMKFKYSFTKKFNTGLGLRYRYLSLEEKLTGYRDPLTRKNWVGIGDRSFNAFIITVSPSYRITDKSTLALNIGADIDKRKAVPEITYNYKF